MIAALASDVELLILDEPTSGLDPLMESVFQETILDAVERGTTVLLSSHILAEVEKLCDRVTIIREGRAVRDGTLAELRAVTRTTVTVATDAPPLGLDRLERGPCRCANSTVTSGSRWTAMRSTPSFATSHRSACAHSSATRRHSKTSSSGSTATRTQRPRGGVTLTVVLDAPQTAPRDTAERAGPASSFVGLGHLLRLALRRDRVRIVLWVGGLVAVVVATVESITGLYSTPAELEQYARIVRGNTALIVQAGPGYGLDDPTLGAVIMNELSVWMTIAVALMNVFVVVRHTRTEESTENAELTRASPVGRYAGTAAALLCALVSTVAVAVGVALVLTTSGLPVAGTVGLFAVAVGAGAVFATLTAVTSQIAASPRDGARAERRRARCVVRPPRGGRRRGRAVVVVVTDRLVAGDPRLCKRALVGAAPPRHDVGDVPPPRGCVAGAT